MEFHAISWVGNHTSGNCASQDRRRGCYNLASEREDQNQMDAIKMIYNHGRTSKKFKVIIRMSVFLSGEPGNPSLLIAAQDFHPTQAPGISCSIMILSCSLLGFPGTSDRYLVPFSRMWHRL